MQMIFNTNSVLVLPTLLVLLKNCIIFSYFFSNHVKNTELISLENPAVPEITKENHKKPQSHFCLWVTTSYSHLLWSCCDFDTHPWGNSFASLHSEWKAELGKGCSPGLFCIRSLYASANGVLTPSWPCMTCYNMKAISKVLLFQVTLNYKEISW